MYEKSISGFLNVRAFLPLTYEEQVIALQHLTYHLKFESKFFGSKHTLQSLIVQSQESINIARLEPDIETPL